MNLLLLNPSDVLFFRDGRPMSGSLSGHGAAWPLPSVTNAALHAALHRAEFKDLLPHNQIRLINGKRQVIRENDRKFGSLLTVGPFPVIAENGLDKWLFPRPLDAGKPDSTAITFLPCNHASGHSSLSETLKYPVANTEEASKTTPSTWWSSKAWATYLDGREMSRVAPHSEPDPDFQSDTDFTDAESTFGIGMDPDTGVQDGKRFYSAHYLRLRPEARLGILATASEKPNGNPQMGRDLLHELFPNHNTATPVIVGGQQRICSVTRKETAKSALPLPLGKMSDFASPDGKFRIKWILLAPAIFPQIDSLAGESHTGGWLPSWIDNKGQVQLLDGPGKNYAQRHRVPEGHRISATLVAAMVGKPLPVSGYALDNGLEDRSAGPKPTHLAVPAGSVYYFECETEKDATALAAALNWHGGKADGVNNIKNRRSTLMGEKGFGIGVCGTWEFLA